MDCHEDIDGKLKIDDGSNTKGNNRAKLVVGILGNLKAPLNERKEEDKEDKRTNKPPFFAKDSKNEIGMMFRDKLEFMLCTSHVSFPEKFS